MTDRDPLYRRHRFPAEVIAHAVWLYFRFPLSLRMVEDLPAARGIIVSRRQSGFGRRILSSQSGGERGS
jgi:putative transposase